MKKIRLVLKLVCSYVLVNWKFFFLGLLVSAAFVFFLPGALSGLQQNPSPIIGVVGNYTISTLPQNIQAQISIGLTKMLPDGEATAGAALSWESTDSGRLVIFNLNPAIHWQDNRPLEANDVNYNLKSVELIHLNAHRVAFKFKDPFVPLLAIVSQPLFREGLVGLGESKVESLKFNGRFLSSLVLRNISSGGTKTYKFYPSENALLTAFKLGSINQAFGLHTISELAKDDHYRNTTEVATHTIATVFFNTQREALSDRAVRQGLTYALPNDYPEGERAFSPLPKDSWIGASGIKKYPQSEITAKNLLGKTSTNSGTLQINLSTNALLEPVAQRIAQIWRAVGVTVEVSVTDILPENYDVYLAYLEVPADPDQYMLWHSTQVGNITHFNSPKIDKLLEDGRKTSNMGDRQDIYVNFQKAITEEVPAVFLFYPKLYTITRN